jgi:hypothetical protein
MPKHNTPHWTDGDGIGERLIGPLLTVRLNKLSKSANSHHRQANEACQGMLEHARQAGEALLEARRRCGHRTKWIKWRRGHFKGSKETSCHYMKVAREWENPAIVDAQEAGIPIDSINRFLKLLRGQPLTKKSKDKSPSDEQRDELRNALRREFAGKLQELSDLELETLADSNWQGMYTFDRLWDKMHERLQTAVAVLYGEVLYVENDDEDGRPQPDPGLLKATKALNERRSNRKLTASRAK